jgi:hypothetical protein
MRHASIRHLHGMPRGTTVANILKKDPLFLFHPLARPSISLLHFHPSPPPSLSYRWAIHLFFPPPRKARLNRGTGAAAPLPGSPAASPPPASAGPASTHRCLRTTLPPFPPSLTKMTTRGGGPHVDEARTWRHAEQWRDRPNQLSCEPVTSRPNKDESEPTSGPSVSGMACVGSCPTLLVEGESHQHINPSARCISTPGLILLREARTKA